MNVEAVTEVKGNGRQAHGYAIDEYSGCPEPKTIADIENMPYGWANVAGGVLVLDLFNWQKAAVNADCEDLIPETLRGFIEDAVLALGTPRARGEAETRRGAAVGVLDAVAYLLSFALNKPEARAGLEKVHKGWTSHQEASYKSEAADLMARAIKLLTVNH